MKRVGLLFVTIAMVILVGGCSKTEQTTKADGTAVGTGGAGANLKTDEFVHDVALKNMAEVELSRMAADRATSAEVKTFAQMMIRDHGASTETLKSLASAHSIQWPAQLDEKHKKTVDDVAKEQGADFDHEYVKAMIESHQDLTAKLESRLDVQSLAEWKTAAAGRTQTEALPDPKGSMADMKVRPIAGGDEVTGKINQWAAETYPVAQKHLDTVRMLENASKKR